MMQRKEKNCVSLVAYVRNDADRVASFLQKVSAVLSENFLRYEIILVDDASTDETADNCQYRSATTLRPRPQSSVDGQYTGLVSAAPVGSQSSALCASTDHLIPVPDELPCVVAYLLSTCLASYSCCLFIFLNHFFQHILGPKVLRGRSAGCYSQFSSDFFLRHLFENKHIEHGSIA